MGRKQTPRPEDLEEMEPEDVQAAINGVIGDIDRRSSINVSQWELQNLEALICVKLDRGLPLTIREQDILDHVEDVRTDFFGARHPRRLLLPLLIILAATFVAWLVW